MKFNLRIDRRNMWVSAPIVKWLWKLLKPSEQHLFWSISAISTQHAVGLYSVPRHTGVQGNEITDELARNGSALRLLGPEPGLEVSRWDIQKRLSRWLVNQHWAKWRGLGDTQRQAQELISGPSLCTRAKFLTINKTQSRVVTGLLTGHNTLRRHLHLQGLLDSPLCSRCGVREESSAHILCECEALASLRYTHLGSFFLESEDINSFGLGAIWNYSKVMGLPWFDMGHKGSVY